jgi:ribosomal protein S18 acetylase RimI-like enzyme
MIVQQCREADLEVLARQNPSPTHVRWNEERFQRHQQGLTTFLIAWVDDVPAGAGEIRWQGCAAPEVHGRFPDCPEINGLAVWPAERRSHGIGTAIVRTAEDLAVQTGYQWIGLGVDDQNTRAAALYLRLGYQETGCRYLDRYHYVDDNGIRHDAADPCRFLIKPLAATPATRSNPSLGTT